VHRRAALLSLVGLLAVATLQLYAAPARAATIAVEILTDELDTDSDCSLREAIKSANTNAAVGGCDAGVAGLDTITLLSGTHIVDLGPSGDDIADRGDLDITESLTINGSGAGISIVSFDTDPVYDRVFHITSGTAVVTFNDMTIRNGDVANEGGGIRNAGILALNRSSVENNRSATNGGGIYNAGTLTVTDSTLAQNDTFQGNGGGIYNASTAGPPSVTVTDSVLSGNTGSGGNGTAITNDTGTMSISGSQITNNSAFRAAIVNGSNSAILNLTNSTISGNTAESTSSGIWNYSTVNLTNATVTGNKGAVALFNDDQVGSPVANLKNSILANTTDTPGTTNLPDCAGVGITASGPNLVEELGASPNTCAIANSGDNITGQDPLLGSLADNGGPTKTHALQPASPAVDAGTNTGCPSDDQRDLPRPMDGPDTNVVQICDLGATELEPDLSVSNTSVVEGDSGQQNAVFTLSLTGTVPEAVTFDLNTVDMTATAADNDYLPVNAPDLTIEANVLTRPYDVNAIGDTNDENNETVGLQVSNPENALLGDPLGVGTIRDDDPVINHLRKISLRLRRHLKASGRVTVEDSYNKCRKSVPVDIQRKKPSGWDTVKSTTTVNDGTFATRLPDKPGRYRAQAPKQEFLALADTQVCAKKTSGTERHRH
jgi:CSLREA domain-containing protein